MTLTWHWAIKETGTQEELALMVSDIAQNFVVTGLTPTDGGGINLTIAAGYARCEGWRIVTDGETFGLTAADDTYYIYLELGFTGGKVTSVTITEYTSEQSLTNRIYLCSVTVTTGGTDIGVITDKRNTYPFTADQVIISGTTGLDDWRHATDLTKIDGGEIYASSILNAALAGSIAWSKVLKSGSNLNEIATRSHTVLSSIGSNSHASIDSHISDTGSPHGTTMSIATQLNVPKIAYGSTLTIESTGGAGIQLRILDTDVTNFSSPGDHHNIVIKCDVNDGGAKPNTHKNGVIGDTATAFRIMAAEFVYDDDGTIGEFSAREDLEDLRKIRTYDSKSTEWGDKVWDAKTIPLYIKDKADYDKKQLVSGKEGMGFINNSAFKGWMISLLKKLDEIDVSQNDQLVLLFDEVVAIKARLNTLEQA